MSASLQLQCGRGCVRCDPGPTKNGTVDRVLVATGPFHRRPVSLQAMQARPSPSDRNGVVSQSALTRARAGDEDAFRGLIDPYRRELQLHCYRILGSLQDAEDAVQETLLAAWRSLAGFEGRASVRSWLYQIATNRCLNALRARSRRPRELQTMADAPPPTRRTD